MRSGTKTKLHIVITILVMLVIFIHSAMPGDASTAESDFVILLLPEISGLGHDLASFIVRKAAHCVVYTVLGFCLFVNVRDFAVRRDADSDGAGAGVGTCGSAGQVRVPRRWAWIIGTIYAATDELHQAFVPGRNGALFDVCLDSVGIAAGVLIAAAVLGRRKTDQV